MAKITIDGVDFEVSDQAAQAVGKLQADLKDAEEKTLSAEEEAKKKEDEMEEAEKEAKKTEDSLTAKLDDANSKIPTADSIDKLVAERTEFVDSVLKICPDIKWEGKDSATLRQEVVATLCPNVVMDSVTKDYISARFDILLDSVDENSQHLLDEAIKHQVKHNDQDKDDRPASVKARENMMNDSQNAWKPKENS